MKKMQTCKTAAVGTSHTTSRDLLKKCWTETESCLSARHVIQHICLARLTSKILSNTDRSPSCYVQPPLSGDQAATKTKMHDI